MLRLKTAATFGAAFVIRLILAPFFGHSWDIYVWVRSGELFVTGTDPYSVRSLTDFPWGFYTYPPVWLYWLGFSYYISNFLNNFNLYILLIKLPILLSDLAVAVLIAKIAAELKYVRIAGTAVLLWLFNPLVILISAVWGMFDSVAVFLSLWGVLMMVRGRSYAGCFLVGLGASVKLYPLFLLLPFIIYMSRYRQMRFPALARSILVAIFGFALPMTPYINNIANLLDKLLYHFGNVGSFTYWTALSVISPPTAIPIASYSFFAGTLYIAYRRYKPGSIDSPAFELSMVTILAFLATSAKVNVQYILWVLPFLIIYSLANESREFRLNTAILVAAGLIFIAAAQFALAIFDLRNIGKIVISREVESVTWGGFLLIISALLGGSRFVVLLMNLLKAGKTLWTVSRVALVVLMIVFLVVVGVFPVGKGVVLPKAQLQVGVTEGVEALFNKSENYDLSPLLSRFNLTHLVLPVGPEAVMFGGDYGKFFRFKLTNEQWTIEDLRKLGEELKIHGVKPVLGLYLKTTYVKIHYGYHGYNSTKFIAHYSECVNTSGNINFLCLTHANLSLAEVFAEKAVNAALSLNFTGLYLMGVEWDEDEVFVAGVAEVVKELRRFSEGKKLEIFVEIDPLALKNHPSIEKDLFENADYIVALTSPYINSIKQPLQGNYTISLYKTHLEKLVKKTGGKPEILFTVHAMDIAEGWMTPALQIQVEVNEFSKVQGLRGYVIYHVSRYLPVKMSFR